MQSKPICDTCIHQDVCMAKPAIATMQNTANQTNAEWKKNHAETTLAPFGLHIKIGCVKFEGQSEKGAR